VSDAPPAAVTSTKVAILTNNRVVHFEIPANEAEKLTNLYTGLFGRSNGGVPTNSVQIPGSGPIVGIRNYQALSCNWRSSNIFALLSYFIRRSNLSALLPLSAQAAPRPTSFEGLPDKLVLVASSIVSLRSVRHILVAN
jgi:hypothetical protein